MAYDLIDGITIVVSIFAVGFSVATFIITYRKGKKTEQMKVAMEISAKLDEAENKVIEIEDQLKKSDSQSPDNSILISNHKDAYLLYMNHWEFYSFLVNNREIDNENIKKYFESNLKSGTDRFFKKYPDYISREDTFEEIKKLLKEIGHEPKVIK
jgi:hypothetical protein